MIDAPYLAEGVTPTGDPSTFSRASGDLESMPPFNAAIARVSRPRKAKKQPRQKPGLSTQDVGTPPEFLRAVRRRIAADFAIDLAAHAGNAICANYYSEAENSLIQPWSRLGTWGWLNPPFAKIGPWVRKAWLEKADGANTAVLIPAGVGSNWWRDYVHGKALVLLLNGRITFIGHEQGYPKDCALLLYGPYVSPGYDTWTWPNDAGEGE